MSLATSRKGGRKSKHREKSVFELLGEVAKLTEKADAEKNEGVNWSEQPGARVSSKPISATSPAEGGVHTVVGVSQVGAGVTVWTVWVA